MRSPADSSESSTSLVDRLTDSLKDKILNGELSADEAVNISAIAKENGVSLIPVREALARLSAWAGEVNGACDHFLACARLAGH